MEKKKSSEVEDKSKDRAFDALLFIIMSNHFLWYNLQMIPINVPMYNQDNKSFGQGRVL